MKFSRTDLIFFAFMAAVGLAAGALLVAMPQSQRFVVPPFFWILIAVGLFELGTFLLRQKTPGALLSLNARLIGLLLGVFLMLGITLIAGVEVQFL